MITIAANLESVMTQISQKLSALDVSKMTRLAASSLMAEIRQRVHVRGEASNGQPIGTYTKGYLNVRKKHGRQEGSKVVLSLTRSMENAMILIPLPDGTGIGYTTAELLQRAKWQEERQSYQQPIWSPTEAEKNLVDRICAEYIDNLLS